MAEAVFDTRRNVGIRGDVRRDVCIIVGLFALLSFAYWAIVLLVFGQAGFPLDDAFIHLQFARNVFTDGQMAFNRGVPSSGSTAPMFPMLLAGVFAVLRDWYAAAYTLGLIGSIGSALVVYGIIRSWTGRRDLARWAGILTVIINPTVVQAYAGMEAGLYSLVCLAAIWLYANPRRRLLASAMLAICIWLRPEFAVVLPLIVLERLVALWRARVFRPAAILREVVPHGVIWAAVAALYVGYHLHQTGHFVPTTFGAKFVVPGIARPEWLDSVPGALRNGNLFYLLLASTVWPLLVLFMAGVTITINCAPLGFGLVDAVKSLWRDDGDRAAGWRLALLVLIGYPLLRGLVDSLGLMFIQQQRYYAHITPLAVIVAVGAIPMTKAMVNRKWWSWRDVPPNVQMRRACVWAALPTLFWGFIAVQSVSNINDMQVALAKWVRAATPKSTLIATNDIGALAFLGEREICDTIGLVEPKIVEHYLAGGDLLGYLQSREPDYVIVFPSWYPDLVSRDDIFERIDSVELSLNVVCGGTEMVVYRPHWHADTAADTTAPALSAEAGAIVDAP